MVAAPSAVAADGGSTKAESAQKKKRVTTKALNTRLNSTRKSLTTTRRRLSRVSRDLGGLSNRLKSGEGSIALLMGAAPQLVSGLQTLGNAVRNDIAPGLLQLKDVLEKTVGPNLTRLGDAYQAVEYGVAKVTVSGSSITSASSATSADIPDDGNAATVQGSTAFIPGGTSATVDFRADIRSVEADNTATGGTGPVGQVGGSLYVKSLTNGALTPCGAPYNTSAGFAGTPAGASIVTPDGPVTNLPLVNIADGKARTDTAGPTSTSTSIIPVGCSLSGLTAGTPYEVVWTANFVDVPTSKTPGAKD